MGRRPQHDKTERLTAMIKIRVTPTEKRLLQDAVVGLGTTISTALRVICNHPTFRTILYEYLRG